MNFDTIYHFTVQFFRINFKLFGLLPAKENIKFPFYLYSSVILFLTIYGYQRMAYKNQHNYYIQFSRFTSLTVGIYRISTIVIVVLIYLCQWFELNKHLRYNERVTKYLGHINTILGNDQMKYCKRKLGYFILIGLMLFIVFSISAFYRLKLYKGIEYIIDIILYLPIYYVVLMVADFYWGVMLIFTYFLKQINTKIKGIISAAQALIKRAELRNVSGKTYFMQQFCDLSDELDKMKAIHFDVSKLVLEFNSLWSKQIMVFLIIRFGAFVSSIYIELMVLLKYLNENDMYGLSVTNGCMTIVQFWTVLSIIQSCADVTNEVIWF